MNVMWGILAIIAGILILLFPHIVAWIVGIYLIVAGAVMMFGGRAPRP